jgi:hypothetical protein
MLVGKVKVKVNYPNDFISDSEGYNIIRIKRRDTNDKSKPAHESFVLAVDSNDSYLEDQTVEGIVNVSITDSPVPYRKSTFAGRDAAYAHVEDEHSNPTGAVSHSPGA